MGTVQGKNQPCWSNVPQHGKDNRGPEQWIIGIFLALDLVIYSIIQVGTYSQREGKYKYIQCCYNNGEYDLTPVKNTVSGIKVGLIPRQSISPILGDGTGTDAATSI